MKKIKAIFSGVQCNPPPATLRGACKQNVERQLKFHFSPFLLRLIEINLDVGKTGK